MNHYHGNCELEEIITTIKKSDGKCINYLCKKHKVLCDKSFWEIGWNNGEKAKDLWGVKYFNNHQFYKEKVVIKKRIQPEYKLNECFDLVSSCIKECFLRNSLFQLDDEKEKLQRIEFANNRDNKLIEMFCDCSNNFEPEKLRKEIIKYSTQKPKTLQERLDDLMTK